MAKAPAKGGDYWIQVGAFKDQANAARLAEQLTTMKYQVQRASRARPVGGGTHEVFVLSASQSEVNGKLQGRDYRAEAVGNEVVIRPPLTLKDAVALSKELANEGLSVKIRRVSDVQTMHVVRVGGYPDQQRARAVQKELEGKGFPGFIVKGEGQ